jgi:hypothetical protein
MNFWKVADLWHTLMTGILGYDRYAAAGCDVGALVTGQLGHKYADALYGIHIGSGQKLTLFNGDRAWDLSGGRPIPSGLPADIHAQVVNGGDVETVFTKDELCTHAMIFWVTNTIGTSMRTYANNNRYPWTQSHDRRPPIEAPTGITFVGYENPPGVRTNQRVQHFLESDRAGWYNHVNLTAHDHGGHFIPWEIPDQWVDDLRRTFRGRR